MSTGNGCAAIGLANTNKIPMIGAYVQDVYQPVAPGSDGPHVGVVGGQYWDRNWLGEEVGFTVPGTSGVATGKTAEWVWNNATPLTVPVDGLVTVTAGVAVAAAGVGLSKTFVAAGTVIPAGSYFWAFLV